MNKPLILDNAINRIGDNKKIFEYDYNLDLNIIKNGSNTTLFIESNSNSSELLTKTAVERERDDDELSYRELYSKTKVKRERDETRFFLELVTKSFVERERDDEDIYYSSFISNGANSMRK